MKLSNLLTIATILFFATACGDTYYEDYYGEDEYYEEGEFYGDYSEEELAALENQMINQQEVSNAGYNDRNQYNSDAFNSRSNSRVSMRPLIDPKTGRASAYAPLPASWRLNPKAWEAPGGTKVELQQGGSANAQQRPIRSVDQLVQQTIVPTLRNAGVQIDNIIDLPGIARNNQKNYSKYWKAMPMQDSHQVKGIEITDHGKGKKGLVIVHLTITSSQFGSMNSYYVNVLSANPNRYEKSKKELIYALENMELDAQTVAAHNQREQQKSNASWSAHNQRMRSNQANFDAFQKTQQTLSEVGDIYHEGWKKRNSMNNAGHSKSINGVWERNAVVNPHSGRQSTVKSGYKYYFVNSNGQYIGTNDEFFNPANDPRMNHLNWRRAQRPSNGY